MSPQLLHGLMTSYGGLAGWLAASAYLHRLAPLIPGHRLMFCWLCLAGATGLVAQAKRRQFAAWAAWGFLFGAPALVVSVAHRAVAKHDSADGGSA